MRIFSKKAFQFDHPTGAEPSVVVKSQDFADVPDWVAKSVMFSLASKAEEVTVIESKKPVRGGAQRKPESDPGKPEDGEPDKSEGDPEQPPSDTPPAE